jgi:predicted RNase H-like HicB family nuclease/uncharacterized damage-inducible protein DinB
MLITIRHPSGSDAKFSHVPPAEDKKELHHSTLLTPSVRGNPPFRTLKASEMIQMARAWSVNLEHGNQWWYAHVAELPGCFTRGSTREVVLASLGEVTTKHLAFLKAHGRGQEAGSSGFAVIEEVDDIPELGESGGAVALFTSDQLLVSAQEFDMFLSLMQWNREELLALVQPVPEDARTARALPGKRTLNETLRHVMNAEEWYISRLGRGIQKEYEAYVRSLRPGRRREAIPERLVTTRQGAVQTLKGLFARGKLGIFTRAAYTSHPEEEWTFRKVLRRFVEHEREHIGTIRELVRALPHEPK